MILKKNILSIVLLVFIANTSILFAQSFEEIRSKYESFEENNPRALPYIKQYISKAKKEKDYSYLSQGYLDESYYNSNIDVKLKYADSAIASANNSSNNELIVTAHMTKGTLYYFYFKKYKTALDEYVKAFSYAKKTNDEFQQHTILYHIGVVKSYLGYYQEALENFKNCISYFEPLSNDKTLHPNLIFNNKKGYYNSLHQAIICYRNLGNFKVADSLIDVGFSKTYGSKEFSLEHAYFQKCKGIVDYYNKSYQESINLLNKALPEIKKNKDFAWESVSYFYLGKSYSALNQQKEANNYFTKVDSIFQKNNFILPELRENYEILIKDSKLTNDTKKELYYTNSLLKADSIITKDFNELSSKIHKEYDTQQLLDAKNRLESNSTLWIIVSSIIILLLLATLYYRYEKEKKIQKKYVELEQRLMQNVSIVPVQNMEIIPSAKSSLNEKTFNDVLKKLERFEKKLEFTEKGLTLNKLAKKFDTNSNYLSQVISEKRNINYNKYLSELRINYITQKLYSDKEYLKLTVEALAEKSGIASRQNFSDLFYEINGLRPIDFIKLRKKELEEQ
ncbi:AraC family transcriptional regulator [Cloacibacterium normanense]|uniref:AraC family transcriptional regulator n=1 Tax=Cloacibacterium normanense TaxID=237258 RepID=A0A2S7I778_9FLAO|nr:AraC family transcriptional regulator [Cloacibacterium normanense]PPZ92430.1 AraC family transcriptional regulator [Cloacibacterium normanense]